MRGADRTRHSRGPLTSVGTRDEAALAEELVLARVQLIVILRLEARHNDIAAVAAHLMGIGRGGWVSAVSALAQGQCRQRGGSRLVQMVDKRSGRGPVLGYSCRLGPRPVLRGGTGSPAQQGGEAARSCDSARALSALPPSSLARLGGAGKTRKWSRRPAPTQIATSTQRKPPGRQSAASVADNANANHSLQQQHPNSPDRTLRCGWSRVPQLAQ